MKRVAFKMFLKQGMEAEYVKRHDAIWPELKKLLSDQGVYDYSIFFDSETNVLFAVQKVKGGVGSQVRDESGIIQRWWDSMADLMEVNPDNSPKMIELTEVFYME
jgi:L-rhamnose mutarotase